MLSFWSWLIESLIILQDPVHANQSVNGFSTIPLFGSKPGWFPILKLNQITSFRLFQVTFVVDLFLARWLFQCREVARSLAKQNWGGRTWRIWMSLTFLFVHPATRKICTIRKSRSHILSRTRAVYHAYRCDSYRGVHPWLCFQTRVGLPITLVPPTKMGTPSQKNNLGTGWNKSRFQYVFAVLNLMHLKSSKDGPNDPDSVPSPLLTHHKGSTGSSGHRPRTVTSRTWCPGFRKWSA